MIYLATDHAGFQLKNKVLSYLKNEGYAVEDCGAFEYDKDDDYPDFISKAAEAVSNDPDDSKAIILGASGQGEAIVANKFKNVRAVVYYGEANDDPFKIISLSRIHNDSNILSLGAKFLDEKLALEAVKIWLKTDFNNEERHKRRIDKIKNIEKTT